MLFILFFALFQLSNANSHIAYAGIVTNKDHECQTFPMKFPNQMPVVWNKIIRARCQEGVYDVEIAEQLAVGVLLSGGSYFAASNVYQFHEKGSAGQLEKLFDRNRPRLRENYEAYQEGGTILQDELDQIYSPVLLSKFLNAAGLDIEEIMFRFNISTTFPLQHLMLADLEVNCNPDDGTSELRICIEEKPIFGYMESSEIYDTSIIQTLDGPVVADCCYNKRGIAVCKDKSKLKAGEECRTMESIWLEKLAEKLIMENKEVPTTTAEAVVSEGRIVDIEMIWNNYLMPQTMNETIRFAISFFFGVFFTIIIVSIIRCLVTKKRKRVPLHPGMISEPLENLSFAKQIRPIDSQIKAQLASELSTKLHAVIENEDDLTIDVPKLTIQMVQQANSTDETTKKDGCYINV